MNGINNKLESNRVLAMRDKENISQKEPSKIGSIQSKRYRESKIKRKSTFGAHNKKFNKHNI